jgi:hypothetical protein
MASHVERASSLRCGHVRHANELRFVRMSRRSGLFSSLFCRERTVALEFRARRANLSWPSNRLIGWVILGLAGGSGHAEANVRNDAAFERLQQAMDVVVPLLERLSGDGSVPQQVAALSPPTLRKFRPSPC